MDLDKGFKQLKHDTEKQIRQWWDIVSLEMYIGKNLTPRSLRWDISPNDGVEDLRLLDEWYQFFNACEQKLMQMMVRRREAKKAVLESKIKELKTTMEPFMSSKEYSDKAKELSTHLAKYDGEIKDKKLKKYFRDTKDCEENRVYKWQENLQSNPPQESSAEREVEVHNTVANMAKKIKRGPSTPQRAHNKAVHSQNNHPKTNPHPYPPTYNSPYWGSNYNRPAPLDYRPPDYGYYANNRNQYPPRPPRGQYRGNFRGRPVHNPYPHQGGGNGEIGKSNTESQPILNRVI